MVDRTAIKTNQFFIILFVTIGFLFDMPLIAFGLSIVMFIGSLFPKASLFQQFYHQILKPLRILKPDLIKEASDPHRFAQGMGGTVLLASYMLIVLSNFNNFGWSLGLLVATLALINLVFGFCAGCFIYFQLSKRGLILHQKKEV
jgi:hypothetical protein